MPDTLLQSCAFFTDVVAGYLAGFVWTDTVILAGRVLSRLAARTRTLRPERTTSQA